MQCASGQCTSRDQQCKTVMGSYTQGNDTYACDSSGCAISCASPEFGTGVCYGLQQNFLDGTVCGGGGHCLNVSPNLPTPTPHYSIDFNIAGPMQRQHSRWPSQILDRRPQIPRHRPCRLPWRLTPLRHLRLLYKRLSPQPPEQERSRCPTHAAAWRLAGVAESWRAPADGTTAEV